MRETLTIYPLQQAIFAFVLVHAALSPSSTVGENFWLECEVTQKRIRTKAGIYRVGN